MPLKLLRLSSTSEATPPGSAWPSSPAVGSPGLINILSATPLQDHPGPRKSLGPARDED